MGKKVVHHREGDNSNFQIDLNAIIKKHEDDGWELIDTKLQDNYDPETSKFYSTALLTFEK